MTNVPGSKLSSTHFSRYWVSYAAGQIAVGTGNPEDGAACCTWTDSDPIPDIRFVGLSAWDKHVGYRNVTVRSPVDLEVRPAAPSTPGAVAPPPPLVEQCCQALLANLTPVTICSVLSATDAITPVADGLRNHAVEAAGRHFADILEADPDGFKGLAAATLGDVLKHQSLICGEKALFDALVFWADGCDAVVPGSPTDRRSEPQPRTLGELGFLLQYIRFPQMSDAELEAVAAHPLAASSPVLVELLREALDARAEGASPRGAVSVRANRLVRELSPSEAAATARFQRRSPAGCTQLIYMYDGDHNGVCWFLGTRYGTQQWVNPALSGMIQVRASSPVCKGTDPRALVSGQFLRTNFAGPRRDGDTLSSWWLLDLGAEHALECNYYTLRHDGSTDFLRNWVLQGSNDGMQWTDLRRHIRDQTIKLPGQYASWPLVGPAAAVPYRYFRVLLLAPNAEAANPHRVCLSFLELYGNFFKFS